MKTLKEQELGKCRHFNGIMSKRCKVGILYQDVRLNGKLPC